MTRLDNGRFMPVGASYKTVLINQQCVFIRKNVARTTLLKYDLFFVEFD